MTSRVWCENHFELLELFLIPFMLTCSIMRFISLLLLGLCACVVCVVMLSLVSLGTKDGCGGCRT